MKFGPLPNVCRTPPERTWTPPERCRAPPGRTGACYGARAADRATSQPPARWCLWVPRCPCALWCASRSPPVRLSDRAVQPCPSGRAVGLVPSAGSDRHPRVLVSCGRGFRRVLG